MDEKKPRTILPPYSQPRAVVPRKSTIMQPNVDDLIDDATNIIAMEVAKFSSKVNKGQSLSLPESRILQGYIKSLVELSKESRERFNDKDLAKMSDEELAQMLETLLKKKLGRP